MTSNFLNRISNYDQIPTIQVPFEADSYEGWEQVTQRIQQQINNIDRPKKVIVVECYPGVIDEPYVKHLSGLAGHIFLSADCLLSEEDINRMVAPDVTDDAIFGYMTRLELHHFFDQHKIKKVQDKINSYKGGTLLVYGTGASIVYPSPDILILVDMARWEIQMRFRENLVGNVGIDNRNEKASLKYKRAFFVDWRVCDKLKKQLMRRCDFVVDANQSDQPKMVCGSSLLQALEYTTQRPFRVVPFFDPGPWGGQWMKERFALNPKHQNYAWGFDCVPEENSLLFQFGSVRFETPAINLVFCCSKPLLGNAVQARFGDEFPIRFDFLDTMAGGNLSLQVHPTTEYIQENFGMRYTQDESYYILDAEEDACVYLGLKENIDGEEMIAALQHAQDTATTFNHKKYVNEWPVKKHDHVLIPAGTIHCSGANSMVLEISATPYIFTFKLWDWGQLGMDGKPRPINIKHGARVIDWSRTTAWVKKNLVNATEGITKGDGWEEEYTGLHEREFIETRRHKFSTKVLHHTSGSVNVLNLVDGCEAVVESPSNAFEPYTVHYAETFIIPEQVKEYTIRPSVDGEQCITIKAYVRTKA